MVKKFHWIFYCLFILLSVSTAASAELVDRIVAVVNDDIITLSELDRAIRPYEEQLKSSGYSREKMEAMRFKLKQDMLDRLVDRKITDQEVKKLGMTVSDQEVDSAVERLQTARMMTRDDLEKALQKEGMSFAAYREKIREEILRPKLINYSVKSKVIITDEDINAYYESHPELYGGEKKVRLRNILITGDALDSALRARFETVTAALDSGESFAEVARRHSKAPNARDGGNIGSFSLEQLSEEIADAVRNLSAGAHSDFVRTDLGYQMFYVENIETTAPVPLSSVSREIAKKLYDEIVEQKFKTWIESLREKSHVKRML